MKTVFCLIFVLSLSSMGDSQPVSKKKKKTAVVNKKKTLIAKKAKNKKIKLSKKTLKKLEESLEILNRKSIFSNQYIKAVTFLENNFYNKAHFETLEILANTYKKNGDHSNQIKVLEILVMDYPENHESYYKLGMAHKNLFLKNHKQDHKDKAINNLSHSIKINRKSEPAYMELLPLLKEGDIHTKNSLSLITDMIRYLKKKEHYIYLCEAYFDNKYLKQSRRSCKKAMKKNPKDPISQILYALSQETPKDINKKVIDIANKHKNSFYVQFKTGVFFLETNKLLAIPYLNKALKLKPSSLKTLKIISKLQLEEDQFEEAYDHFLKACLLSKGGFFLDFQKATSQVAHKNPNFEALFKKGLDECFNSTKSKKN